MTATEAERELAKHLESGERLVWSGVPRQGIAFRKSDLFLVPFSVMWGGFAIFWEASVLTSDAPLFFYLWGIPFVLVGLYIMFGRFVVDARMRARAAYGLTDRRIIIVSGLVSRSVKSLQLRTLSDLTLEEKIDGGGTITFGPAHPAARWFAGAAWPGTGSYQAPAFELIPSASEVYRRIRDAQVNTR